VRLSSSEAERSKSQELEKEKSMTMNPVKLRRTEWLSRLLATTLIAGVAGSGCASISSLTTAKVLPKGKSRFYLAGGYSMLGSGSSSSSIPYFELMFRRGIADRFDAGVKWTAPFTVGGDLKFGLITGKTFAMALGGMVGYFGLESGSSRLDIIDVTVPVYFSLHPGDVFAIYAVPKFLQRIFAGTAGTSTSTAQGSYAGGSAGIQLGNETLGIVAEGTYMYCLTCSSNSAISQFGGAFYFGFGK
jgi:hypothetical protein